MFAAKGKTLFYALDIEDGNGLQIFKRVENTDCHLYKIVETWKRNLHLHLLFSYRQWKIIRNLSPRNLHWDGESCVENGGDLLYLQEGEIPYSEGWYDNTKNITDVVLSVYALEECSMYNGAYVDADKLYIYKDLPLEEDLDACLEDAFSKDRGSYPLVVTTQTLSNKDESESVTCKYNFLLFLTGGEIIQSNDERAKIFIGNKNCYKNSLPIIKHISEAKLHNENLTRFMTTEGQNTREFPLVVVIGSRVGAGAVVLLVVLCVWRRTGCGCCGQKNFGAGPGQYGKASIDSNFQYGEGKEYYQYQNQNDKKQTRIVDENEMYEIYEN